jgi:hypothetical protein
MVVRNILQDVHQHDIQHAEVSECTLLVLYIDECSEF